MRSIFILATLYLCSGLPQNNLRKSSVENNESVIAKGEEFGPDLRKTNFKANTVHEAERNSSPFADSVIGNVYTDSRRAGEFIERRTKETTTNNTMQDHEPEGTSSSTQPTPPTTTQSTPTTTTQSTQPTKPPTTQSPTTQPTKPPITQSPTTQPTKPPTTQSPTTQPTKPPTTQSSTTQPPTTQSSTTQPTTQPTKPPTTNKPNSAGKIGFASLSTFVILVLGQLTFKITFFT